MIAQRESRLRHRAIRSPLPARRLAAGRRICYAICHEETAYPDRRGGMRRVAFRRHAENHLRHRHGRGLRRRGGDGRPPRACRRGEVRDTRHLHLHARQFVRRRRGGPQRLLRPSRDSRGLRQGAGRDRHAARRRRAQGPPEVRPPRRRLPGMGKAPQLQRRAGREQGLPQGPRRRSRQERDVRLGGFHHEHAPPAGNERRRVLAPRRARARGKEGRALVRHGLQASQGARVQLEVGRRLVANRLRELAHADRVLRLRPRPQHLQRAYRRRAGVRLPQSRERHLLLVVALAREGARGEGRGEVRGRPLLVGRGDRVRGRPRHRPLL